MKKRFTVIPASYVLFEKGHKILLLKRANTGYRDGYYSFPAGHLNGGESALNAAVREAFEETGVRIRPEDLKLIHTQHRVAEEKNHERINLFFETKKWTGKIRNMEPNKCDDLAWFDIDKLPDNMVTEVVELFKQLKVNSNYGHFGFDE